MVTVPTRLGGNAPAEFEPFLAAMADAPGEATNLLVFADWLDEHDRPALAKIVHAQTPRLRDRYRRAVACHDALLSVDLESTLPVPMPLPNRDRYHPRRQLCGIVREALRSFKLPGVSVAVAHGWRDGPDIELRLPSADFSVGEEYGTGFVVPWSLTSAGLLAVGVLVFATLMARLFPEEGPRVVHTGGNSFDVSFWRVTIRPQS